MSYSYDRRHHTAALRDGPVGRFLLKHWNDLHDVERELEETIRSYADAEHFMGGPAEKAAEAMIKQIKAAVKALEDISMGDDGVFGKLAEAEREFVKKFGEPSDYSDQMRREIFPR